MLVTIKFLGKRSVGFGFVNNLPIMLLHNRSRKRHVVDSIKVFV